MYLKGLLMLVTTVRPSSQKSVKQRLNNVFLATFTEFNFLTIFCNKHILWIALALGSAWGARVTQEFANRKTLDFPTSVSSSMWGRFSSSFVAGCNTFCCRYFKDILFMTGWNILVAKTCVDTIKPRTGYKNRNNPCPSLNLHFIPFLQLN